MSVAQSFPQEAPAFRLLLAYANGNIVLSWPVEYRGAQLERSTDLRSWSDVPNTVNTNRLLVAGFGSNQFFRLRGLSIPTVGLVAAYWLNGSADDSVGDHHGIIRGGAYPTSNRFTNGTSAYAFNGTDDAYIEIPDHDDFSISTTGEFSISVWIRPGALGFPIWEATGYVHWMGKGVEYGTDNGDQEWLFRMYNLANAENRPNRISFYVFSPEGGRGPGSFVQDPVTVQVWIHFAATVNVAANRIRWYKNGVLEDSDPLVSTDFTAFPRNGPAPVRLGTMNFESFFTGSIDNLLFYNRELTAVEVIQLYNDKTR